MSSVIIQSQENILKIILNRPESLNAFNTEMLLSLQSAFREAESDSVRCVILTGAGKGFCSGQDLRDFTSERTTFREALEKKYNPLIIQIMQLPKPVICGINGVAAGAGLSLALACDFRIAVENAQLIEVFVNVGLVPDSGSTFNLPRMAGLQRAFHLCSTADRISASEAKRIGIVNVVVQNTEVLECALDRYALKFANGPTRSLGLMKRLINTTFSKSLEEALSEEAEAQDIAGNSEDYREGVSAFIEKRKATFTGK